jgi:hypothetical protein
MADRAQETPESRLYTAGFTRQLEFWVTPDGERVLDLNDALAALDAGEVKPVGLEIRALSDQPGFRELTAEAVDALADRLFRPPPPAPPPWLEPLAVLVVQRLKPVVRVEVRAALRAEARRVARERMTRP